MENPESSKEEEIMDAAKERFRLGQVYANIGTWEWNIKTGELYWSERIPALFGYTEGEVDTSYENFLAAVHPDDRDGVITAVNNSVKEGAPYEIEHRVVWQDGSVRWLLERGAVVRDKAGNPLRMIGVVQDIDARKKAEIALRRSESKLSGLYTLSPLGIALTDMQGRFLEFNEAFVKITGYEPDELYELDYWVLTPREYEDQEVQQLESLNKTGRYGPYEKVYTRKDGRVIPIRLNGILVSNEDNETQIWSIIEDISDSKKTEVELIAARNEAQKANQAKSEFLSSMSHELRTPLNAIMGFAQLLDIDESLGGIHNENVKEILNAGKHLLELINEILDLSKIESGNIALHFEVIDICSLVQECLRLIAPLAQQQNISLSHSGVEGLIVRSDYTRLKQIILNLLSNAIKYNRENGRVSLDVIHLDNKTCRIQVSDTGIGIPDSKLSDIFQPFTRAHTSNTEIEGTGVGLTITKKLVELMGGTIQARSKEGVGSEFWIDFPAEIDCQNAAGSNVLADRSGKSHSDAMDIGVHRTVLHIEDNSANLRLVKQILTYRGNINLLSAHHPSIGIELARVHLPDLILLDINLPGMNGYKILEILRNDNSLKNIPVIALSANATDSDIARGMAAGFNNYQVKPINVPAFLEVINQFLDELST